MKNVSSAWSPPMLITAVPASSVAKIEYACALVASSSSLSASSWITHCGRCSSTRTKATRCCSSNGSSLSHRASRSRSGARRLRPMRSSAVRMVSSLNRSGVAG